MSKAVTRKSVEVLPLHNCIPIIQMAHGYFDPFEMILRYHQPYLFRGFNYFYAHLTATFRIYLHAAKK